VSNSTQLSSFIYVIPETGDTDSEDSEWGQEDSVAAAALSRGIESAGDDDDARVAAPSSAGEKERVGQRDGGREEEDGVGGAQSQSLDLEGTVHGSVQEEEGENDEDWQKLTRAEDEQGEEEPLDARQLVVTVVTARDVPVRLRAPGDARRRV